MDKRWPIKRILLQEQTEQCNVRKAANIDFQQSLYCNQATGYSVQISTRRQKMYLRHCKAYSFSNLWQFCWIHTKKRPKKVGNVITSPGLWSASGSLFRGQSSLRHSCHMVKPSQLRSRLFGGEVSWHSEIYELHNWALVHTASRRVLFAKIPSLPLVLDDSILVVIIQDSWPQVRIGKKTDIKTESFAMFENSSLITTER